MLKAPFFGKSPYRFSEADTYFAQLDSAVPIFAIQIVFCDATLLD